MKPVTNRDPFPEVPNQPRVGQQRILPAAVKSRSFSVVEFVTETFTTDAIPTDDNQYAICRLASHSRNGDSIVTEVEWGVFFQSGSGGLDLQLGQCIFPFLPDITTTAALDFQVIGPGKSVLEDFSGDDEVITGRTTLRGTSDERLMIINISAGPGVLYFMNQVKQISNGSGGISEGSS